MRQLFKILNYTEESSEPVRLAAELVRLLTDSPFDWCYSEPAELLTITFVELLRVQTCPPYS
ncbi:MAG TPA: hypothetical protein PKN78_11105, partial [Tenuifilaceae bacterium]|nr:hypothetical protein [Tenuifilaceae bacterium]